MRALKKVTWCATIGFVVMFTCRSRLKLLAVCCSLFASGVVVPCLLVLFIRQSDVTVSGRAPNTDDGERLVERRNAAAYREEVEELRRQLAELENIKTSARNELSELERKLSQSKAARPSVLSTDSKQLVSRKDDTGSEGNEDGEKKTQQVSSRIAPLDCPPPPSVAQPPPIVILSQLIHTAAVEADAVGGAISDRCSFPVCFDYARCSLTRPFSVYVYGDLAPGSFPLDHVTKRALIEILNSTSSLAPRPQDACLFVLTLDMRVLDAGHLEGLLQSLPHWGEEGTNHVLLALQSGPSHNAPQVGRAIAVGNTLHSKRHFRSGYDILLPILPSSHDNPKLTNLPSMLPELRSFLLYFGGSLLHSSSRATPSPGALERAALEILRDALKDIESVAIDTTCREGGVAEGTSSTEGEWALCGDRATRLDNHAHSTFSLVLPGGGATMGGATLARLLESLQGGSVPVVVGVSVLPLGDVIDWSRAALLIPPGRLGEIHYILRGLAPVTVTQYRLQGRMIWHAYFSSLVQGLSAVVALLRQRTGHPPPRVPDYVGRTLVSAGTTLETGASPAFVQNWTVYAGDVWNRPPGPFYGYPLTPYKPVPLSGVQYEGVASSTLMLLPSHIVQAGGTTGEEFEVCCVCVAEGRISNMFYSKALRLGISSKERSLL